MHISDPSDLPPENEQTEAQVVVARWERLASEGKTDELLADGLEVLGSDLDDSQIVQGMFRAAIRHDARSLANLLLSLGVEFTDDQGLPSIHTAIGSTNSGEMVAWLLSRGADPNVWLSGGDRPLHFAVRQNNVHAIEQLVKHGADINGTDLDYGNTPLELAASLGRIECVRQLVALRAHVRSHRIEQIAAKRSKEQIMAILKQQDRF